MKLFAARAGGIAERAIAELQSIIAAAIHDMSECKLSLC